jgi:uncharacterized protein
MSAETLKRIHNETAAYSSQVEFIWHGGEPLLAGHDFFRQAIDEQQRIRHDEGSEVGRFRNILQSNFTLLDSDFVGIFKEMTSIVGTSLDGMREIHDQTRPHLDGRGSYDEVMRGIELIREAKIPIGVIACYTKLMVGREKEVYQFMKDHALDWQLSAFVRSGRGQQNMDDVGITPNQYAEAIKKLFDLYIQEQEPPNCFDTVETLMNNLIRASKREKTAETRAIKHNCQENYIGIDWNGDVYPCGRFTTQPEFRLGNINEQTLSAILEHPTRKQLLARDFDTVDGCPECKYKRACDSGCLYEAYVTCGDPMKKDFYCEAYKDIWGYMLTRLVELKKRGVVNARR